MDIEQIIAELEQELGSGKNVLFSKKTLIDVEKCVSLVDELKRNLPTAIQEASYVLAQKEKLLSQAQETANRTIKEAELRAEQLVSESDLIKHSEDEAKEIEENTEKRCTQLYNVTKENVDKMLKSVEDYFQQNLNIVRSNREELNNTEFIAKKK